ncbi:MAG: hypothetical protein RL719_1080 [Actinomycetota bacterium]|jgi:hypothetical protein
MPKSQPTNSVNRVLIAIYAVLALAALGRSSFELATKFGQAPVPYSLSAAAAIVYLFVTISFIKRWSRAAFWLLAIELIFVLSVGFAGLADPNLFPEKTVWTTFGIGYGFFPLFMPIIGLFYLNRWHRK